MSNDYKDFDCYKILDIPQTASPQEIRHAYLKKSKEHHPDVGGSNEQQVKINLAYAILSDPLAREQHDRYWSNLYDTHFTTPKANRTTSDSKTGYDKRQKTRESSVQQLFTKVAKIFDQTLASLKLEKDRWVKEKISSYEEKVYKWKQEQEAQFQQKVSAFEERFKKLREEQLRLFNQQVARYNSLHAQNTRLRKKLFYAAVILSEVSLLAIILPFAVLLFSFESIFLLFAIMGAIAMIGVTVLCWLWYATTKWLLVGINGIAITDSEWRKKIRSILVEKYSNKYIIVESQKIAINAPDGIEKIRSISQAHLASQKIAIRNHEILYSATDWRHIIMGIANQEGDDKFHSEESNVKTNKEKFLRYVAEIADIVEREITLDTSEEQAARRIAITFFMMGYYPILYDGQTRVFIFSDGDEKIVIRFRHRAGAPTNISYVKDMVKTMAFNHSNKGFLFCTPGLSQNAAKFANINGIKWYSLETMNEWIDHVLASDYSGPTGDILQNTERMVNFLRHIALSLRGR